MPPCVAPITLVFVPSFEAQNIYFEVHISPGVVLCVCVCVLSHAVWYLVSYTVCLAKHAGDRFPPTSVKRNLRKCEGQVLLILIHVPPRAWPSGLRERRLETYASNVDKLKTSEGGIYYIGFVLPY